MSFDVGSEIANRYRITRVLGAGGMGEVYAAHDAILEAEVALKTLRPELQGSRVALERFRREIALARRVTDSHVCRVYDVGEHAGRVFLTMELLDGKPLAGPLPIDELERIAPQLVHGLQALHAAGIVHRDFKTANVIVANGRAIVTDFGLARTVDGDESTLSIDSGLLGTPAYMAPEQVEGRVATPASDVYALGIVLFELATGKRPFDADTAMATATARLTKDSPKPSSLRPELPATWDALILRCLARDPAARPALDDVLAARGPSRRVVFAAAGLGVVAAGLGAWRLLRGTRAAKKLSPDALVAVLPVEGNGPMLDDPLRFALSMDIQDALGYARIPMIILDGHFPWEIVGGSGSLLQKTEDPTAASFAIDSVVAVARMQLAERPDAKGRLAVQMTFQRRGAQAASRRFERPLEEATRLPDDIATAIANELGMAGPKQRVDATKQRPDAYAGYGAALANVFRPDTRNARGLADFVAAEPRLVRAHVRYASHLVESGQQREENVLAAMDEALEVIDRVLAIDPDNALAHAVRGSALAVKWDWAGADAATKRAVSLAPTLARVEFHRAYLAHLRGDFAESCSRFEELARRNPLWLGSKAGLSLGYLQSRRFEDCVRISNEVLPRLEGDNKQQTLAQLSLAYAELSRHDKAIEIADQLTTPVDAHPYWMAAVIPAYVMAGNVSRARELRARVGDHAGSWVGAQMDDALGNLDAALAAIEATVESHNLHAMYIKIDRFTPALRSHPRYQALVKRVGLS